jgi:hypothetical protein
MCVFICLRVFVFWLCSSLPYTHAILISCEFEKAGKLYVYMFVCICVCVCVCVCICLCACVSSCVCTSVWVFFVDRGSDFFIFYLQTFPTYMLALQTHRALGRHSLWSMKSVEVFAMKSCFFDHIQHYQNNRTRTNLEKPLPTISQEGYVPSVKVYGRTKWIELFEV